jgi:type I restriction enzyme S subunit
MSLPRYGEYKESGVTWLGEVPAHWVPLKVKVFTQFCGGGTPSRDNLAFWNGDIPWVSPKDMKFERIKGAEECITNEGLSSSSSSLVDSGRLLMVVRSGILKHTIPVAINDVPVALNQDMKALRFKEQLATSEFFFRWVQGQNNALLLAWAKQGATVESIEHNYLAETLVPLPPLSEQSAIATFLDRETGKIDALIAEQEKLLTLLAEKRQATISHAVTRGLNPNAPMKDSGVPWLGKVPAHWEITSLGRISMSRCDGPFGSGIKSDHYTEEGAFVVRLQNIRAVAFNIGEPVYLNQQYFETALRGHEVLAGDLLVAGLGDEKNLLGRACVAPSGLGPALVKADCFRFRLRREMASPNFSAMQLSAGATFDAGMMATGTTRSRMPLGVMASRKFALPPLDEQSEIVDFVEAKLGKFDVLKEEAEAGILLLKERRSALIAAAVTGKIDVRQTA